MRNTNPWLYTVMGRNAVAASPAVAIKGVEKVVSVSTSMLFWQNHFSIC
jgi:hypothetical protein